MTLNFAELGRLERLLKSEGSTRDASVELNRLNEWLSSGEVPSYFNETLARLAEAARSAENARAAEIAIGSLVFVRRELKNDEGRCQAVLHFARQRVDSLESGGGYFSHVVLAPDDEADARALYEAAIGDESYSTRELIDAARAFIQRHDGENSVFGRLAADLSVLLEIVDESDCAEFVEIARAALTYFAETADAIPDDLGLVGLLDDAYIVRQAVDHIYPNRASLTNYLEERAKRWPFIKSLKFDIGERPTPVSDYMLVNSALLLDALETDARPAAIVVADAGPLPYFLGLVAALARVSDVVNSDGAVLERGDRLIERGGKFEVIFNRYLRQEGESLVICDPASSTHIQVIHPARGRNAETLHTIPVAELGNFRRSTAGHDKRKRPVVKVDVGGQKVGVLEQLFGTTMPIMLDLQSPVVLVVAPVQRTRSIAKNLMFFGAVAADVVPTGHIHRSDTDVEIHHWSKFGLGGEPMLCIARSVDEAYECIVSSPFEHRRVSTVVAEVRPNSPDAVQLGRIADHGVGVLGFVKPEDTEALDILKQRDTMLWLWDQQWFGRLFWPHLDEVCDNKIIRYERRLKRQLQVSTDVDVVDFDELTRLGALLTKMGRTRDEDAYDPLSDWVTKAWWLLLRLSRMLTPPTQSEVGEIDVSIERLSRSLKDNQFRWEKEPLADGQSAIELFTLALTALKEANPKYERLQELVRDYPGSTILIAERDRARMVAAFSKNDVRISSREISGEAEAVRIIPAWYGQNRMGKLAFASTAERQILLLYPLEAEWFDGAKRRRARALSQTKAIVTENSAIPIRKGLDEPEEAVAPPPKQRFKDIDEVLKRSIYRFVGDNSGDGAGRVNAKIVGFVGGAWAAFTLGHRIVVASHLVDAEENDSTEVISTNVSELQAGDIILLLRESDRDAVRERALRTLPSETIRTAETWQRVLREYVDVNPGLEELRSKLKTVGCERSVQTIRNWISNDWAIGPQNASETVLAIANAIGSSELLDSHEACVSAIGAVRSAHVTAGKLLAKRVVERAREWAEAGATPDDLIELEDQLVMATVDFVDAERTKVPTILVNRLQVSTWQL